MTRWDILLGRLREHGFGPSDEDYVENYGLYAVDEGRVPRERRFRCTRGWARLDDTVLEVIAFPSEDEASDFLELVRAEGKWTREGRVLVRVSGPGESIRKLVADILRGH